MTTDIVLSPCPCPCSIPFHVSFHSIPCLLLLQSSSGTTLLSTSADASDSSGGRASSSSCACLEQLPRYFAFPSFSLSLLSHASFGNLAFLASLSILSSFLFSFDSCFTWCIQLLPELLLGVLSLALHYTTLLSLLCFNYLSW